MSSTQRYLITLTSPLAVRLSNGTTILSNVVEAEQISTRSLSDTPKTAITEVGMVRLSISGVFNTEAKQMVQLDGAIEVTVKASNLRSRQAVGE